MQTKHNPLPMQMACIDGVPWRQAFGAKPSSISCYQRKYISRSGNILLSGYI